jgi:hypothetical protein
MNNSVEVLNNVLKRIELLEEQMEVLKDAMLYQINESVDHVLTYNWPEKEDEG